MRKLVLSVVVLASILSGSAWADTFSPGQLVVSRSVYSAPASTITVGQSLPGGGTATNDATYPYVFNNEKPDPSFGITSQIYLDALNPGTGSVVNTLPIPTSTAVTSFPSKSELSLNLSADSSAITFMGYASPVNTLDVSNANTSGHVDPTNPVSLTYPRAVVEVGVASGSVTSTSVNAYSGNNGRAAVLANGNYYLVGNAGNSGSGTTATTLSMLSDNTGVQMIARGSSGDTTVVGKVYGTNVTSTGYQRGFSVTQVGLAADKTGKDDNFRGETLFNNTLYVTKGSGSNGVNTVYQVGTAGSLPTLANAGSTTISVLPGFPTNGAKDGKNSSGAVQPIYHPFGLWFANAHTLYVGDEGDGTATDAKAGLEKWTYNDAAQQWQLAYTLQTGLHLGQAYTVAGYPTGTNSVTGKDWAPATAGLRDITGVDNGDGTVTVYAITATMSGATDQGGDPNKLMAITDTVGFTTAAQASAESFTQLDAAASGEVLRGVVYVPEPASLSALAIGSLFLIRPRRRAK